jgi:hypothetical protein
MSSCEILALNGFQLVQPDKYDTWQFRPLLDETALSAPLHLNGIKFREYAYEKEHVKMRAYLKKKMKYVWFWNLNRQQLTCGLATEHAPIMKMYFAQ